MREETEAALNFPNNIKCTFSFYKCSCTNNDVGMTTKVENDLLTCGTELTECSNIFMCILQSYINPVTLYVILHDRYIVGGNLCYAMFSTGSFEGLRCNYLTIHPHK